MSAGAGIGARKACESPGRGRDADADACHAEPKDGAHHRGQGYGSMEGVGEKLEGPLPRPKYENCGPMKVMLCIKVFKHLGSQSELKESPR